MNVIFCNFTESWWFWNGLSKNKVPNSHFFDSIRKSNNAVLWTVISNQMIMDQFPNTRFDQIVIIYNDICMENYSLSH